MMPFYISLKPFLDYRYVPHPTPWEKIFANQNPLEVEIGPGNGEYLARLAQDHPDTNFVGLEEYCDRINKTLRKLSRVQSDNVRLLRMDVRPAFQYLFAPQTIRTIHCLYPPPWPKKSDAKHRLFTTDFLRLVNNRLLDAGRLKIVSDQYSFILWIQQQLPGAGYEVQFNRIAPAHDTKFERKWVQGGQREFFQLVLTKKYALDFVEKKEEALKSYTLEHFNPQRFHLEEYSQAGSDGSVGAGLAVVFKDLLYDQSRRVALVHMLVNDEHISQNIRIVIFHTTQGWRLNLAEGTMLMPTAGVAKALELVYQAALATEGDGRPCLSS